MAFLRQIERNGSEGETLQRLNMFLECFKGSDDCDNALTPQESINYPKNLVTYQTKRGKAAKKRGYIPQRVDKANASLDLDILDSLTLADGATNHQLRVVTIPSRKRIRIKLAGKACGCLSMGYLLPS